MRSLHLAYKDLLQIGRDWRAGVFLLISPILFTLFFGFLFSSGSRSDDSRIPVGCVDQDHSTLSRALLALLAESGVIRLETSGDLAGSENQVVESQLAALLVIPAGYGQSVLAGAPQPLALRYAPASAAVQTVQPELEAALFRLNSAVRTAELSTQAYAWQRPFASPAEQQAYFDRALERAAAAWRTPPVAIRAAQSGPAGQLNAARSNPYAQSSPGMLAQFAIAGLMGAAEVLVRERKSRALQRLLTTDISRLEILTGHYLAMFTTILGQFIILIGFGQAFLGLNYAHDWLASALVAVSMAAAVAAMGLLIGVLAQTEEQVIIYTLIPMFVFAGLGGAWIPLEITPLTVQRIGHLSPVAWMMDGFKNILIRGLGWQAALLPAGVLAAYGLAFGLLAVWCFRRTSRTTG